MGRQFRGCDLVAPTESTLHRVAAAVAAPVSAIEGEF
jgi:hypothetical protein